MVQVDNNTVLEFLKKKTVVKNWIEEVLKVKLGDDLIAALKNGIVLCYLMAEIEPLSIPKIQEATKTEFRLKENVSFFLYACQEIGMAKYERFQPNELWGTPNVARVVECIYCLAKIAAQRNFSPTMKPIDSVPDSKVVLPQDKALQDLKSMLATVGGARAGKVQKVSAELMRRKLAYLVGQNVDFSLYEAGFIKFQALYRGFAARQKYKKRVRDLAYRERVAQEILKTERDYVHNLDVLIKVFLLPLSDLATSKKPVLTKEQIKGVFADIQSIFTFNDSLLKRLEERVGGSWSVHQKLGDIFVDIVSFLKVYTNYVQNFNNSLSILSTVGKRPAVAKFLKDCSEDSRCKSLDLSALLIMPVQRIPRYHLLLQDLVKHTWVEHCDFEHLSEAMEKVKQVGSMLNEKKREAEALAETFERHSWIKGKELDVTPDRRFIREDTFTNAKKNSDLTVFLFSDIIVCGKPIAVIEPGKTRIKYKGQLTTIDCVVAEKPPVKNNKLCFSVGDFVFAAKTEEERAAYIAAVKKVKEVEAMKLSSHLKARMEFVPKKNNTLKKKLFSHSEPQQAEPAQDANSSVEDLLRMRKKQTQNAPVSASAPNPAIARSNSSAAAFARANSSAAASGPVRSLDEPDKPVARTSSSGSLHSDGSDGETGGGNSERDTLANSKNSILQRLLGLPTDPKKDTKKTKKQRVQWEHELEVILRKLAEMDQHTNVSPIRESDVVLASPTLSSRSSPQIASRGGVSKEEYKRNFTSTGAVAVPLSVVSRDETKRAFNSVRGFQPNASPPGIGRTVSSPVFPNISPPLSPNNSPSPPGNNLPVTKPTTNPLSKSTSAKAISTTNLTPTPTSPSSSTTPAPAVPTSPTRPPRPLNNASPLLQPNRSQRPAAGLAPTLMPRSASPNPNGPRGPASPNPNATPNSPNSPNPPTSPSIEPINLDGEPAKATLENLTLHEVKQQKHLLDTAKLESYLSEAEFMRLFKVSREAFYKQPKWKQEQQKRDYKIL